jgi:rfaE bifunctional protein nucleotidyltransferase chain/domain
MKIKRVLVNGTFDVLHIGHLALLEFACKQGDHLTVAIDSDRRVRQNKGPWRPINTEQERRMMLEALRWVDQVIIFDTDQDLINIIDQHDAMVKGSDHRGGTVIGQEQCRELIWFDRIDGYSTTNKIQDIIAGRQL